MKKIDKLLENQIIEIIKSIQNLKTQNKESKVLEIRLDEIIFDIYELTENERSTVGYIEIK